MRARAGAEMFVVARNPQEDSRLPYLVRLPLEGGIALKARDRWPATALWGAKTPVTSRCSEVRVSKLWSVAHRGSTLWAEPNERTPRAPPPRRREFLRVRLRGRAECRGEDVGCWLVRLVSAVRAVRAEARPGSARDLRERDVPRDRRRYRPVPGSRPRRGPSAPSTRRPFPPGRWCQGGPNR